MAILDLDRSGNRALIPDLARLCRIYSVLSGVRPYILGFMRRVHSYSRATLEAASLLGARVREGRLARRWTQVELADRIGVSSDTVTKVERGNPTVALGIALEAARLVGVPLFSEDDIRVSMDRDLTAARLALLPARARTRQVTNDF
jgi:DNA-binding XRE family transcriptional regulator